MIEYPMKDVRDDSISILIIDPDKYNAENLHKILSRRVTHAAYVTKADEGLALCRQENGFDVVIMESVIPGYPSLGLIDAVRELNPDQKVILLTGEKDFDILLGAIQHNVDGFILKPATVRQIEESVHKVCSAIRNAREREKAEKALATSHTQMLAILDNLEAIVYVSDMQTYEILYANAYLKKLLPDVREGGICWQSIQEGQTGPCPFCTNPQLLTADGTPAAPYIWNFQNTKNGRWYHIVDKAITWSDGRIVRLEIATEIPGKDENA